MSIRPVLPAFCATVALFVSTGASAHSAAEIMKPICEQAIPMLPGELLRDGFNSLAHTITSTRARARPDLQSRFRYASLIEATPNMMASFSQNPLR